MNDQTRTFGQSALAAIGKIADQASPSQSTRDSIGLDHKRKFLETFRRWEILFKRKDGGDIQAEKWLIAEYYDSLRHLTADGFDALTAHLKENCTFFPTIRECLEFTNCGPYDYSHRFYRARHLASKGQNLLIAGPQPVTRHLSDHITAGRE